MTQTLQRFTRNGIQRILEKYHIEDAALETELIEFCWEVRAFQAAGPRQPKHLHPAVQLVKRLMRLPDVPEVLFDEIISYVGETPDESKVRAAYLAWCRPGWNTKSFKWLPWLKHGIPADPYANREIKNGQTAAAKSTVSTGARLLKLSEPEAPPAIDDHIPDGM